MRRAQLPLAMSQGFHPKPRVSYYGALSLGFSSRDEVMEIVLEGEHDVHAVTASLNAASVPGLEFYDPEPLAGSTSRIKAVSFDYETVIPDRLADGLASKVAGILAAETVPVSKSKGREIDLKRGLLALSFQGGLLYTRLAVQDGPEATMREVLAALGLGAELFRSLFPVRTKTNLA